MHRLQFHYTFTRSAPSEQRPGTLPHDEQTTLIRNPLIDMLQAVQAHGSISAAARAMGLSYRHVWGELKRWETQLGHALIVWDKGQSARLTEFGTKLLWAERQAQARLSPQIEALHADMERAFAAAFDDAAHVLTLYASHDDALSALRNHAASRHQLHLDIRFTGSVDAIRALNEGRCVMAGFHTRRQPAPGSLSEASYKPLLKPGLHKIIGFAQRTQGLIVARGNPLALNSLQDVSRTHARYVNRALGTGTRVLLDELLAQARLTPGDMTNYEHTEPSHAAVAQAVAAGQADAGLGIEAAARARGLDFVPLVEEDYHLVCLKSALDEPAVQALCKVLQSTAWQEELGRLPGYHLASPQAAGKVLSLKQTLPWWSYRSEKQQVIKTAQTAPAARATKPAQMAQERKPQKMSSRPGK